MNPSDIELFWLLRELLYEESSERMRRLAVLDSEQLVKASSALIGLLSNKPDVEIALDQILQGIPKPVKP